MVSRSTHGPVDCCWHILFALWIYANGFKRLLAQATCLVSSLPGLRVARCRYVWLKIWQNQGLGITNPMHHGVKVYPWTCRLLLACSICRMDVCQWIGKTPSTCHMPGSISSRRRSGLRIACLVEDFAKIRCHHSPASWCQGLPMDLEKATCMLHLPFGCIPMDWEGFWH